MFLAIKGVNMASFIPVRRNFLITEIYHRMYNRVLPCNYTFRGEKHNFWEIEYVVDGQVELTEGENVYLMKDGDIIFHSPMEFHRLNNSNAAHLINLSFKTSGDLPPNLTDGFFSLDENEKETFLNTFHKIYHVVKEAQNSLYAMQEAAESLETFIINICKNYHSISQTSTTSGSLTYKTLVELMNHNVLKNITIEDLAVRSYVSVSYIKALFYRYARVSPKAYYNDLRISAAQDLLKQGMPVNEVSEKMNFSSPNYFSLFFKKHTNMTPLQYKKTLK